MNPQVTITSQENNRLYFTLNDIDHSLANSLRRIILSEIPTLIFRTFPHSESKVNIIKNTTRLNNEIIKQRIGCIPIHITDTDFPYKEYSVEVDKQNDSDTIQLLTTEDFKIKHIPTDKYLSSNETKEIFPPDPITGDYIPITRLRPKLSENMDGEEIVFSATLDIGNASQDGMYNVVSTCAYGATMDNIVANDKWNDKKQELQKQGLSEQDIEFEKLNWFSLDAKRITVPNSFDFVIESIGVFTNINILYKACDIMIQKCKLFTSLLEDGEIEIEKNQNSTVKNEFLITIKNEDYTLGNAIVYFLYEKYFVKDNTLTFVGFKIPHPHIPEGIIRMAFKNDSDSTTVSQYLTYSAAECISVFEKIQSKINE